MPVCVSGQKQYSNDYCSDAVWHNRQQTDANESPILHTHISNPVLRLGEIAECAHHAHILNQILQHAHDSESNWAGNDYCGWTEKMLKRKRTQKVHDFPNFCRRKIDPGMASVDEFAERKSRISLLTREMFAHVRRRNRAFGHGCHEALLHVDTVANT